jgi:hypothetical protein
MQRTLSIRVVSALVLSLVVGEHYTHARESVLNTSVVEMKVAHPLSLARVTAFDGGFERSEAKSLVRRSDDSMQPTSDSKPDAYREISDFFHVREANINTAAGEWELELEGDWVSGSGRDDDFTFTPNIKYGLNDDMFIELEVRPVVIGDGGRQGEGDTSIQLFYQIARETEALPAFAAWAEARIPSGEGSAGVDGELHFSLTKTLAPGVRGHLVGFAISANGGRGDEGTNRRSFQWAAGAGLDYQIDDLTICTVSYFNRSSEDLGNPNQNILEIGGVRRIAENQHLKLAFDIGLDGHEETRDFGVKTLWSFKW